MQYLEENRLDQLHSLEHLPSNIPPPLHPVSEPCLFQGEPETRDSAFFPFDSKRQQQRKVVDEMLKVAHTLLTCRVYASRAIGSRLEKVAAVAWFPDGGALWLCWLGFEGGDRQDRPSEGQAGSCACPRGRLRAPSPDSLPPPTSPLRTSAPASGSQSCLS